MLRLELTAPQRVVFDMRGSEYYTLLDVRKATSCPGEEVTTGARWATTTSVATLICSSMPELTTYKWWVGGSGRLVDCWMYTRRPFNRAA